jgi:hypothetical protein
VIRKSQVAALREGQIPADWDEWLAAQGLGAGFLQTTAWADISAAISATTSYALTVEEGGRRLGGMLVSLRPARHDSWSRGVKTWLMRRHRGTLECFGGPILVGANRAAILERLIAQLDALAVRLGIRHLRFAALPPLAGWADAPETTEIFRRFRYRLEPWLTGIVDLASPEDALRRNLKQAARKGIRKSQEAGLTVSLCDSAQSYLQDFCAPFYEALAADGRWRPEHAREAERWRIDGGRHFRFFVAKDRSGAVHGTLGTFAFNGVATEIMSCRSLLGRNANLPAQDLLHWEAFRAHKAAGDRYFNLAGYSPSPRDEKEAGIRRFKQKWGGRELFYPEFVRGERPALVQAAVRWMEMRQRERDPAGAAEA